MAASTVEPINLSEDRVRFLCEHKDGIYKLYMGNNMVRRFTDETLPDEIKSLLGMINAFDWDKLHEKYLFGGPDGDDYDQFLWKAKHYYPIPCTDIGWRLEEYYALVVPHEYFLKLKGQEES